MEITKLDNEEQVIAEIERIKVVIEVERKKEN